MCGPNCLYLLLALHDVPVEYGVVEQHTPEQPQGMSLLELQQATNRLGLKTHVRRCSIDELGRSFQSPVIALLNQDHYVVVTHITDSTVTMLDGTTGERDTVPRRWLQDRWSGFVLVPSPSWFSGSAVWGYVAISFLAALLLVIFALKRQS